MGWYDAFRDDPSPSRYEENRTAVTVDVFDARLVFGILAVAFSFVILLPGYMPKERYSIALRTFLSLFVGSAILFSNYGMEWEKSEIDSLTQYKAFMSKDIKAKIGVKVGLRGINVTLKGLPVKQMFDGNKTTEQVDYNERFVWNTPWSQGRLGYGHHANHLNNEYRESLKHGIPYPILLVAEYFTMDGELMTWGRRFRVSGFYTQMFLWLAFTLWVITNVLFLMVIRYGAYFLSLTGVVILTGNVLYDILHAGHDLTIPFPEGTLEFKYGWCFWLSLFTGLLCFCLGVLIVVIDYFYPGVLSIFFNIDIVNEFEDVVEAQVIPSVVVDRDGDDGGGKITGVSSSDERLSDTTETSKRVQFVATCRYAGISHRNPKKAPLVQTTSYPMTCKETSAVCDDEHERSRGSPVQFLRRCMSVGDDDDNMDPGFLNEVYDKRYNEHGGSKRTERELTDDKVIELTSISEESASSPDEAIEETPNGFKAHREQRDIETNPKSETPDEVERDEDHENGASGSEERENTSNEDTERSGDDYDDEDEEENDESSYDFVRHEEHGEAAGKRANTKEYITLDIMAPDDDDSLLRDDDIDMRRGYDNGGYQKYNGSTTHGEGDNDDDTHV